MTTNPSTGTKQYPVSLPSPVPTAKGIRSAADEVLSRFIDTSLHIPNLDPEPISKHYHVPPANISNYRLLEQRDVNTVRRMISLARQFGAFTINCHEIFHFDDLQFLVAEFHRVSLRFNQICCVLSGNETMRIKEWKPPFIEEETSPYFSEHVETVAGKLEGIAELLCKIIAETTTFMKSKKKIQDKDSILRLYTNNETEIKNNASNDCVLSLHLQTSQSHFSAETASGPLSFVLGPQTILVTIGSHMKEWSQGEFKCIEGGVTREAHTQCGEPSLCIELKHKSLSSLKVKANINVRGVISIKDQILFGLSIIFLYDIFFSLYS